MEQEGEITELTPPHRIAWTWGGEAFSFDVAPDGDGCRLEIEHRGSTTGGAGSPREPPSRRFTSALPRRSLPSLGSPGSVISPAAARERPAAG